MNLTLASIFKAVLQISLFCPSRQVRPLLKTW